MSIHIHVCIYIYIYIYIYTHIHVCIYVYIYIYTHTCFFFFFFCLGGRKGNSEIPRIQFVHEPGLGIPTSPTPDQQPALAMPQFGEQATFGPEALCGGGHAH